MPKSKYTRQPTAEASHQERMRWVMAAMSGQVSVAAAARELKISRVQMHNLINRMATAMVEAVTPQPPGRPAHRARERELEQSNQRLERENHKLRQRVETVDRLLEVASQMIKRRLQTRAPKTKPSPGSSATSNGESEEPEDCRGWIEGVRAMRACGLSAALAAAVAGSSAPTIRRWQRRLRDGRVPRCQRGGGPPPRCSAPAALAVAGQVRSLHGLIGADALRSCEISRRQALRVKRETLTAMENERKAACGRVLVSSPGVMRGFDAMDLCGHFALIASDANIPFRTSALGTDRYDSSQVLRALEIDFSTHGAPLVLRLDRASCHRTQAIDEFLDHYGVLRLHGPPHHPRYYGQLERQNREHRQWLALAEPDASLQPTLDRMLFALNTLWPRPTLGGHTAAQLWEQRPALRIDRPGLRQEVIERSERIKSDLKCTVRGPIADFAWRLSVEHALSMRGLLTVTSARRC